MTPCASQPSAAATQPTSHLYLRPRQQRPSAPQPTPAPCCCCCCCCCWSPDWPSLTAVPVQHMACCASTAHGLLCQCSTAMPTCTGACITKGRPLAGCQPALLCACCLALRLPAKSCKHVPLRAQRHPSPQQHAPLPATGRQAPALSHQPPVLPAAATCGAPHRWRMRLRRQAASLSVAPWPCSPPTRSSSLRRGTL